MWIKKNRLFFGPHSQIALVKGIKEVGFRSENEVGPPFGEPPLIIQMGPQRAVWGGYGQ